MRTPIQPIPGVLFRTNDKEQAAGMQSDYWGLTEDLLGVTRIENQSLKLTKERVQLNEVLENAVIDFQNHLSNLQGNDGNVAFTCRLKKV